MRDILSDIVRHTASLFDIVKVTGTDTETRLDAIGGEKYLIFSAHLKQPQPEFAGVFGLGNLPLLQGLLNFPSYKADTAKFAVKREAKRQSGGRETVTELRFRDALNAGSNYKTTAEQMIPEMAIIGQATWDIDVVPTKAKVAEFAQLAALYADIKLFGVHTIEGALVFSLGEESASTNNANLVFASEVAGTLKQDFLFNTAHFLAVLKLAGSSPVTVKLTRGGVMMITVESEHALYSYYLRAKR